MNGTIAGLFACWCGKQHAVSCITDPSVCSCGARLHPQMRRACRQAVQTRFGVSQETPYERGESLGNGAEQ